MNVWELLARVAAEDFPDLVLDRPAWHDRARCRGVSVTLFFPDRGYPTRKARSYCEQCPVQTECRDFAIENDEAGLWGDTSAQDRRELRRRARQGPAPVPVGAGP
jgi:WhiB family redox-sensing transcriptional regulator